MERKVGPTLCVSAVLPAVERQWGVGLGEMQLGMQTMRMYSTERRWEG